MGLHPRKRASVQDYEQTTVSAKFGHLNVSLGVDRALSGNYDLVVMDVMLPEMDGFEVLRRIRTKSGTPVLMLTARGDDLDRILGLEMGADDYLPKPFNTRELSARVRAILQRANTASANVALSKASSIRVGDLELNAGT